MFVCVISSENIVIMQLEIIFDQMKAAALDISIWSQLLLIELIQTDDNISNICWVFVLDFDLNIFFLFLRWSIFFLFCFQIRLRDGDEKAFNLI